MEEVLYGIIFLRLLKEQCFLAITVLQHIMFSTPMSVGGRKKEKEWVKERVSGAITGK